MSAFTSSLFLAVVSLLALVSATPVSLWSRDVFVPPIFTPTSETVWVVAQKYNITWDTSDAPVNITNPVGRVLLATNGIQDVANPLAENFSILAKTVEITVPSVPSGNDYAVVLFGDSGNYSPTFTIVGQNDTDAALNVEISL